MNAQFCFVVSPISNILFLNSPYSGRYLVDDVVSRSFIHNKKKTSVGAKFERSMNVACVVNLDSKSPNANTVQVLQGTCIGQNIEWECLVVSRLMCITIP